VLDGGSQALQPFIDYLVGKGFSMRDATDAVGQWQTGHKEVQKKKHRTKSLGLEAIWHCAVCGRGGQPQPVCYVAPYISSFRKKDL